MFQINKYKLLIFIQLFGFIFTQKNRLERTWKDIKKECYNIEDQEMDEPFRFAPTMVFSVIGDSDRFAPRPWPKTVFQTALIEAAKSGGGMLIYK